MRYLSLPTTLAAMLAFALAGAAQNLPAPPPQPAAPFIAGDNSFSASFPGPVTATPLRSEVAYTSTADGVTYRVLVRNRDFQGQPGEGDADILSDYVASFLGHLTTNYQKYGFTPVFEPAANIAADNAAGLAYSGDLGSQQTLYQFWLTARLLYVASVTYPTVRQPAPDARGFLKSIRLAQAPAAAAR